MKNFQDFLLKIKGYVVTEVLGRIQEWCSSAVSNFTDDFEERAR